MLAVDAHHSVRHFFSGDALPVISITVIAMSRDRDILYNSSWSTGSRLDVTIL